jgi:alkanesulfonate monooxygenase SsuD/methylene tetrahydromethanopterin reductase-like flavin-dependent oxidoreductase (luciferase family)
MTTPADSPAGFLLGVNVAPSAAPGADPVGRARRAEELGFDFVSANDHPCGTAPSYETWTMLTWIAARTTRIKVATRVLGVPYRAPALVAKMAESLDRLSNGRLILGMGGGSADDEFRAFGLRVPAPRAKVEGLEEAVQIVRGLWTSADFTFRGVHYETDGANIEPKPAHRIPIWLGTFGPAALAVTGRVADGWIPTLSMAPPDAIPPMRDRIFAAARAAGRDPSELTLVYNVDVHAGRDRDLPPHVIQGSGEEIAEALAGFREIGFRGVNLSFVGGAEDEQMAALAEKVVARLRESEPPRAV